MATSVLQQAFLNDDVDTVLKKVQQGSYPQELFKKAIGFKAFKSVQAIATNYPSMLSGAQWCILAENECIDMDHELVVAHHEVGSFECCNRSWLYSAVAWEKRGVSFSLDFYERQWASSRIDYTHRVYTQKLACLGRMDVVVSWFNHAKDNALYIDTMERDLWDHAVIDYNGELLDVLVGRSSRLEQMQRLYGVFQRARVNTRFLRSTKPRYLSWDINRFMMDYWLKYFVDQDDMFLHLSLFNVLKPDLYGLFNTSLNVSPEWEGILRGVACANPKWNPHHNLYFMIHALHPKDVAKRIAACSEEKTLPIEFLDFDLVTNNENTCYSVV